MRSEAEKKTKEEQLFRHITGSDYQINYSLLSKKPRNNNDIGNPALGDSLKYRKISDIFAWFFRHKNVIQDRVFVRPSFPL